MRYSPSVGSSRGGISSCPSPLRSWISIVRVMADIGTSAGSFELAIGTLLRPQVMDIFDNDLGDMPDEVLMVVVKDPDGNFIELLGPRK